MFAVIRTGGKQYRVTENDRLVVEKLTAAPGDTVRLGDVLMVGGDQAAPRIGSPVLGSASVFAEVLEHKRDAKVLVFKKRRRKNSRRLRGHRQNLTVLRVTGISESGEEPATRVQEAQPEASAPLPPEATPEPTTVEAGEPDAATDETQTTDTVDTAVQTNGAETEADVGGADQASDETKKD